MSEIKKQCTKCKEWKPATPECFYKHPTGKDGLASKCISCTLEYRKTAEVQRRDRHRRQTEEYRKWRRQYEGQDGKGYEIKKTYRTSQKGKDAQARYRESEKGKENAKRGWRKETYQHKKQKRPAQIAARVTVANAIRLGKIPSASALPCVQCGGNAQEYHHYLGYSKEHRLDVIPVCRKCHRDLEASR